MYYFPFRQYRPSVGQWVTRDPIGMVDGPNLYSYVEGNPVQRVDRLGLYNYTFHKLKEAADSYKKAFDFPSLPGWDARGYSGYRECYDDCQAWWDRRHGRKHEKAGDTTAIVGVLVLVVGALSGNAPAVAKGATAVGGTLTGGGAGISLADELYCWYACSTAIWNVCRGALPKFSDME
jgi:hypothetical protein